MSLTFRPMLAASEIPAFSDIRYPILASPKLDGIRCIMGDGVAFSRNMKRIPNKFIQQELQALHAHGLDGELMIKGDFNEVQSAVMSFDGKPDFVYNVFDNFTYESQPFKQRLASAEFSVQSLDSDRVKFVRHHWITSATEMEEYFESCLAADYEGVIVRDPNAPYKQGRSTPKQGWMSKLKKFYDDEAVVIGVKELFRNLDTSTKKQENMIAANMLGALQVKWRDQEFEIGSGFTEAERVKYWHSKLIGKTVTFKYQEVSRYGIPRFPVFKGFRNVGDIS